MWQCPKCNRKFDKKNQIHSCSDLPKTFDEYIAMQSKEVQPLLYQICNSIDKVLPTAQKRISWSMPTYWENQNIIHFAAFKNHIGLYPAPDAIIYFSESLKDYKTSKGAIQFPYDKSLPIQLIETIAKWCYSAKS